MEQQLGGFQLQAHYLAYVLAFSLAFSSPQSVVPVMNNKTQTGRAQNRRAEIEVFR